MKSSMTIKKGKPCDVSGTGLVDGHIDTAYDVVKEVRDNLDILKYLYDLLKGKGVVNATADLKVIENSLDGYLITGQNNSNLIMSKSNTPITYILGEPRGVFNDLQVSIVGCCVIVTQMTDALVYFTPAPNITILCAGELRTQTKGSSVGFIALSANQWVMVGDHYLGESIV